MLNSTFDAISTGRMARGTGDSEESYLSVSDFYDSRIIFFNI
jgi:hypothetical protein